MAILVLQLHDARAELDALLVIANCAGNGETFCFKVND